MKKIIDILFPKEINTFLKIVFYISIIFIPTYEFWLTNFYWTDISYKFGLISSKLGYSYIAASIFYVLSQYIPILRPKRRRKEIILHQVYLQIEAINVIISNLQFYINIADKDISDYEILKDLLEKIDPASPASSFPNWYQYLRNIKTDVMDISRSITPYNEFISNDLIIELVIIERNILKSNAFLGYKTLQSDNLDYATLEIQEILSHNKILKKIAAKELDSYKTVFEQNGNEYRKRNFS